MAWYRPMEAWRLRQARRGACAAIRPLIERSRRRLLDIPDSTWRDPYILGLLSMLVTLHARHDDPTLADEPLGLIQAECVADVTGLHASMAGAEICFLSTSQNRSFMEGCRQAIDLFAALRDQAVPVSRGLTPPGEDPDLAGSAVGDVWERLFDAHVASPDPTTDRL